MLMLFFAFSFGCMLSPGCKPDWGNLPAAEEKRHSVRTDTGQGEKLNTHKKNVKKPVIQINQKNKSMLLEDKP